MLGLYLTGLIGIVSTKQNGNFANNDNKVGDFQVQKGKGFKYKTKAVSDINMLDTDLNCNSNLIEFQF